MTFFFLVLIICFALFLFRLYFVAKDDLVLAKKNITLQNVFDSAFVTGIFSLFFARLFYVIFNPDPVFLNPLVFLIFPYFPGLSLLGGVLGGVLTLFLFARYFKFPIGRVFDFFTVSLTFVLPIGLIGFFILSGEYSVGGLVKLIMFTVIGLFANLYFYPKARSLEIKDGSISILFLIFLSLTMLLTASIDYSGINNFIKNPQSMFYILILISGIVMFIKQELMGRKKVKSAK